MATKVKEKLPKEEIMIDGQGKSLGRLSVLLAHYLQAKHKRDRKPNVDYPIYVRIKNPQGIVFTGHKLKDKMVYKGTGYVGHTKEYKLQELWQRKPLGVIQRAVAGMLPKNKLRPHRLKRIHLIIS